MADMGAQPAPKEDKGPHGAGEGDRGPAIGPQPGRQVRRRALVRDGVYHFPGDQGKGNVHEGHHYGAGAKPPDPGPVGTVNDYSNKSAIMIPQSVVSENAEGKQYCFALEKSAEGYVAKRLTIETGKTSEDFIEVLEGIENGALLITEGAKKVSDNQPVKWLN